MLVQDYMTKFDDLTLQSDIREDPRQTLSRFYSGLKPEIQQALFASRTL